MSLYPISDIKYHSEFQKSRVQNLSCEMICIGSTRMRLLFVSAPFRGYPRTLTRFRRESLGILETALYEYHIHELSEMNWLQYSLSVWNMMVSWSIAGLFGCQAKTPFGGLSPLPNKMWRLLRKTLLDHPYRKYGLSKQHHMPRRLTRGSV